MYTWVCTQCGARWERIAALCEETGRARWEYTPGALQPASSSMGPLNVQVKPEGVSRLLRQASAQRGPCPNAETVAQVDRRQQEAAKPGNVWGKYPNPETIAIERQRSPRKFEQSPSSAGPEQPAPAIQYEAQRETLIWPARNGLPDIVMIHSDDEEEF